MTTDVFYATLKTSINQTGIFAGNLPDLTKLLLIYQILIATIFIVVPFLFLLFFIHILKTLFRKIAIIFKILVANNIGQISSNETDNLKQVKVMYEEKLVKIKPVKKEKLKKMRKQLSKTLPQNLDVTDQQIVLTHVNKQLVDKMDLENKKNNDTINSNKKKYNIILAV